MSARGPFIVIFPASENCFWPRPTVSCGSCASGSTPRLPESTNRCSRFDAAVRAFLAFFAEHPEFVELLIQERAQFKDRKKPTFIEHREANVIRWQQLYRGLMAAGRIRQMPAERISDVFSHLLYGTIFMNYFSGEPTSVDKQTSDIVDVVFRGILTADEWRGTRLPIRPARRRRAVVDVAQSTVPLPTAPESSASRSISGLGETL